jgi:RHS repeat-associated protein
VWEYENRTAATAFTKTTLHVAGPAGRCAQVEKVLTGADATSLPVFHVHGDHLGSGQCLTKADGTLLCQEEFFAYGRSSDRRDTRNRYRYIGVERDEDTGLCMTGPRTYDPVSGRFLQGDPVVGGAAYVYARGNPIRRVDPNGYGDLDALATQAEGIGQCPVNPPAPPKEFPPGTPVAGMPRSDKPIPIPTLPTAMDNLMSWAGEHVPDTTPGGAIMRNLPIMGVTGHTDPNHDAAFYGTAINLSAGALSFGGGAGAPGPAPGASVVAQEEATVLEMSTSGRVLSENGVPVIRTLDNTERAGLRGLFGSNEVGAGQLLDRLNAGEAVPLPEGVTAETLQTYRQVATQMIDEGKDIRGTQDLRRQAIDLLLGKQ